MAVQIYNPSDLSPASSYGVQLAEVSQVPSSSVDGSRTSSMSTASTAGDHFSLHWNNPLFWLLVLVLLFVGYIGFMFDFSVKRIGEVKVAGGKR